MERHFSGRNLFCALYATLALVQLATAGNPYCENQPFFLPDGTNEKGAADWSSYGKTAAFVAGECTGVSGLGATETFKKTVIIIDRAGSDNTYLKMPNNKTNLAYAQEWNLLTRKQRPLNVITNPFCSSGQHFTDGTLLSIGGDWSPDYATPGEFSIRTFTPCANAKCDFKIVAQLAKSRWYPTTAMLGNGHMIVVGGSSRGVGLNTIEANVPFIEYYPNPTGASYQLDLLVQSLPYNLYPFVHVLPSGKVFIFAGTIWTLWNTATNEVVPGNYPPIKAVDAKGEAIQFSYPLSGTSALFPLTPANKYTAEVIICGGSGEKTFHWENPNAAEPKQVTNQNHPSTNKCFLIKPEAAKPVWAEEEMKLPRVMGYAVLLPDGHVLLTSGTGTGYAGFGDVSHKASLTPDLYNTKTHTWYEAPLATSKIARSYHNSAVLLHDGSVLISGSNPNTGLNQGAFDFPTEFRTEFFIPPYHFLKAERPILLKAPATQTYGKLINLVFKYAGPIKELEVVLAQPGFSTHGNNHGMRVVGLQLQGQKTTGKVHAVNALVPLNKNLVPPTWYWTFVVVNGVPNKEGVHVFIK